MADELLRLKQVPLAAKMKEEPLITPDSSGARAGALSSAVSPVQKKLKLKPQEKLRPWGTRPRGSAESIERVPTRTPVEAEVRAQHFPDPYAEISGSLDMCPVCCEAIVKGDEWRTCMPTGAYSSVACYMNTHLHCFNQYSERCLNCCEQAATSMATGKVAAAKLCQEALAEQDAQDVGNTEVSWSVPPDIGGQRNDGEQNRASSEPPSKRAKTVNHDDQVRALCKLFNDARGCAAKRCPRGKEHKCDRIKRDGTPCLSKKHGRSSHPKGL